MDKPTFQDAVALFSKHVGHWEALLDDMQEARDVGFYQIRDGMDKASDHYNDSKIIGAMAALDGYRQKMEQEAAECLAEEEKAKARTENESQ